MPIAFECLRCGKSYQAPDHLAGKTIKCRACGETVDVPNPGRARAPAATPPARPPAPPQPKATIKPAAAARPVSPTKPSAKPARNTTAEPVPVRAPKPAAKPVVTPTAKAPRQPEHAAQGGAIDLTQAFAGAGDSLTGGPITSPGAQRSQGGGRQLSPLIVEGLLGTVLLVSGGGLYWAYNLALRVTTHEDRIDAARSLMDARRTPPPLGGPRSVEQGGDPRGSSSPGAGRRPPFTPPQPPFGPPPRQPPSGNR